MQIVEQFEMVDIEADDADIACARMPKIRSGLVEEGFFAKQPGSGIDARGFKGSPSEAGRARFPVTACRRLVSHSRPLLNHPVIERNIMRHDRHPHNPYDATAQHKRNPRASLH